LVVLFYLVQLIRGTFPLVEEFPVIIKAKDQSLYYPHLLPIKSKDDKEVSTVDEAVAKYLLSVYIKDREEYDYSNAEIYDINQKFNRLKNTSSVAEYSKFKLFMSKDNPNSPIYNFGKNVVRKVKIESILFIKEDPKNLVTKAKNFLQVKLPTQAQVRFVATTETTREIDIKDTKEEFVADIGFTFSGASKDEKDRSLNFTVNNYQLYKVEK
jgi:type IV secretory pathway component VirB8